MKEPELLKLLKEHAEIATKRTKLYDLKIRSARQEKVLEKLTQQDKELHERIKALLGNMEFDFGPNSQFSKILTDEMFSIAEKLAKKVNDTIIEQHVPTVSGIIALHALVEMTLERSWNNMASVEQRIVFDDLGRHNESLLRVMVPSADLEKIFGKQNTASGGPYK